MTSLPLPQSLYRWMDGHSYGHHVTTNCFWLDGFTKIPYPWCSAGALCMLELIRCNFISLFYTFNCIIVLSNCVGVFCSVFHIEIKSFLENVIRCYTLFLISSLYLVIRFFRCYGYIPQTLCLCIFSLI